MNLQEQKEKDWLAHWNNRYAREDYAFGTEPNDYLREQLNKLNPGTILFGAEGEGRNAVFAAKLGWQVSAFDISANGKKKADQLASKNNVSINYKVGQLPELSFEVSQFDAIALIYAHFPAEIKSAYHKILDTKLRKGGIVIFEAFGKNHLAYQRKNPDIGGPRDLASLFSTDELKSDFQNYEVIELVEQEAELREGPFHSGFGSVVRFVGRKK